MADVEFRIDSSKLSELAFTSSETRALIEHETRKVASTADSLSAGFRTGLYYRDHKAPPVGNTPPVWKYDVQRRGKAYVGIVVTGNYSAMKNNTQHNTLLKAL